jgi:type VI protein secretion system component Hcp
MILLTVIVAAILATLTGAAPPATDTAQRPTAYDILVKFGSKDIEGPVGLEEAVAAQSFTFGVENPHSAGAAVGGDGGGRGGAKFKTLQIARRIDRVSPVLFRHVATGFPFDTVEISFRKKVRNEPRTFLTYRLFHAFLVNREITGAAGDDEPMEMYDLAFGAMEEAFIPVDDTTGAAGRPIAVPWSQVLNKPTTSVR